MRLKLVSALLWGVTLALPSQAFAAEEKAAEPAKAEAGGSKSKHWAYQPLKSPEAPAVKNQDWVRTPIDAFVLAPLELKNWRRRRKSNAPPSFAGQRWMPGA
ncbi:hypothetical protein [Methylomonas koyamae]|uniref:hypothetical protein n=1 Tax=Methylomonas koyamae TaxID=702114 RepID=UPI000B13B884|nr:hypothetical protein [Methylomonas koyamae]